MSKDLQKLRRGERGVEGGNAPLAEPPGMPPKSTLQKLVKATYQNAMPRTVDDFTTVGKTPTLALFLSNKNPEVVVLAIRGTKSFEDLRADAALVINNLQNSSRFQSDLKQIKEWQQRFPPPGYKWYGVAHSLGGAILDQLLKMHLLIAGVSYGAAVQPGDIHLDLPNERIYNPGDPLGLIGQHTQGAEVRPDKRSTFEKAISFLPGFAHRAKAAYDAHKIDAFIGGVLIGGGSQPRGGGNWKDAARAAYQHYINGLRDRDLMVPELERRLKRELNRCLQQLDQLTDQNRNDPEQRAVQKRLEVDGLIDRLVDVSVRWAAEDESSESADE